MIFDSGDPTGFKTKMSAIKYYMHMEKLTVDRVFLNHQVKSHTFKNVFPQEK